MKGLDKVLSLLKIYEGMIKVAQMSTAQAGDIETALKSANLFNISAQVSPLLDAAKIPDDAKLSINIVVDKNLNPTYPVRISPPSPSSHALEILLKREFGKSMRNAFLAAKLNIATPVSTKWLEF